MSTQELERAALYVPNAEKAVLGAILLDEQHLVTLTVDEHLRPEHFADPALAAVFKAAIDLSDLGRPIDHLTVTAQLADNGDLETAGGPAAVEELTTWTPVAGNARAHGQLVRERHQARELLSATRKIQADVLTRDAPIGVLLERADQLIGDVNRDGRHGGLQHTWTPEQLRDEAFDELGQPAGEVWSTSFPYADDLLGGGLSRGEQMLIGGDEKIGKSMLVDQILEYLAARKDIRAHLYINEMSRRQRRNRMITRATGIPTRALKRRDLTDEQSRQAARALAELRVGITECQGWTAAEIVRDIKRHRWDVCAVDIAHNIAKTEPGVAGWDAIAQELRAAPVQVDGVMILAVHLRKRNTLSGAGIDVPVLDDIRDTGMFAKLADQVLFVARDRDEKGIVTADGVLSLSAVRDGEPGIVPVTFDASRLRFRPGFAQKTIRADQYPVNPDAFIEGSDDREFVVEGGARF